MTTEETARSKRCRIGEIAQAIMLVAIRGVGEGLSGPVISKIDTYGRCIASDCMMWRREKDTYGDDYGKDIPDDRGFCGLGGKP